MADHIHPRQDHPLRFGTGSSSQEACADSQSPVIRARECRVTSLDTSAGRQLNQVQPAGIGADREVVQRMAQVLQRTPPEAAEALDTAGDCRVDTRPLLARHKGVSVLSPAALSVVETSGSRARLRRSGIPPYRRPDPLDAVRHWLAVHDRITSGDHALLTSLPQPGALNQLNRQAGQRGEVRFLPFQPVRLRPVQSSGDIREMMLSGSSSHTVEAGGLIVIPTLSQPGSPQSHH